MIKFRTGRTYNVRYQDRIVATIKVLDYTPRLLPDPSEIRWDNDPTHERNINVVYEGGFEDGLVTYVRTGATTQETAPLLYRFNIYGKEDEMMFHPFNKPMFRVLADDWPQKDKYRK